MSPKVVQTVALALASVSFSANAAQREQIKKDDTLRNSLPAMVVKRAAEKNIDLKNVTRQGKSWVACIKDKLGREECVVLLTEKDKPTEKTKPAEQIKNQLNVSNGDTIEVVQYDKPLKIFTVNMSSNTDKSQVGDFGQIVRENNQLIFKLKDGVEARVTIADKPNESLETRPIFIKKNPNLICTRDPELVKRYISERPNENFMVVISVPPLCPACVQLEEALMQSLKNQKNPLVEHNTRVIVLQFPNWAGGQEILGGRYGASFPTTVLYGSKPASNVYFSRVPTGEQQAMSDDFKLVPDRGINAYHRGLFREPGSLERFLGAVNK